MLAAGTVLAEEPPRVVVIEDPAETIIRPRLRAELASLGLDVQTLPKREDERLPRDLVAAARDSGAVAAFRVVVEGNRADVWIADRVTGKVVLRELLPRGPQIDGRLVALRAVELLRVSLLELDAAKVASGEASPPTTGQAARLQASGLLPDLERFSLAAGPAVLWSPGGCGPGLGIAAALAWRPTWLGVRLAGGTVLAPATLTAADAGTGEVSTRWLAFDAFVQPRRPRLRWRPRGGIGVAALATSLDGVANAPRPSFHHTVYTLSPILSFDLAWAVHPRVRVVVGAAYLRPLRGVDILVGGQSVGSYGRDIVLATLGVDVVLP